MRECFQHPLLTGKLSIMTHSPQTTIPLYQPSGQRDWGIARRNRVIYTNLPVSSAIVRLPHTRSGDSQRQEMFLAPFADKYTCNYDKECSNYHPSISTLSSNGLSHSKMKCWAIYTWNGDSQGQKTFSAPSGNEETWNYDTQCSKRHPFLSTSRSKRLELQQD